MPALHVPAELARPAAPARPARPGAGRVRRGPAPLPGIDHISTLSEITLVGDSGQIYRGPAAWVVTLWALSEYRPLSHKFSTPAGARLARAAVLAAAKYRQTHRDQQVRKAGGRAYRRADGWVYDRVDGWTYYGPAACDSGCHVPD